MEDTDLSEKGLQHFVQHILHFSKEHAATLSKLIVLLVSAFFIYLEQLVRWVLPPKKKSLQDQVILITGSAGGLGQEIGLQLANSGAKLVLWDVCTEANAKAAETLRQMGVKHVYLDTVDVSNRAEIVKAAEKVRRTVGHVTILVNNAGIAPIYQFLDLSPEDVRKTFDVNVLSQFWTIQEFLPQMIENGGQIVTIASTMSHMSMKGSAPYFATKHAVHGFIECLKHELVTKGVNNVKFTTAYPFFFKTNLLRESDMTLKFRFPSITPYMEATYVAEKIVEGIRREQEFIYLPRTFWVYLIVSPFLPSKLYHALIDLFMEECIIPPRKSEKKLEETEVNYKEQISLSQTAPRGKHQSFLTGIEKVPLDFAKLE